MWSRPGGCATTCYCLLLPVTAYLYRVYRPGLQSWDCGPGQEGVLAASWSSSGQVLLAALKCSGSSSSGNQLVALHLVGGPPSFKAQLMPVMLPDINLQAGAGGEAR